MIKIDIDAAPRGDGTTYPDEFAGPCLSRRRWKLGDAAGLTQFGVNLLRLPDGAANPYLLQAVIIAAGLSGLASEADPGQRYDIDMYAEGHTIKDAPRLPLNLLDALRGLEADTALTEAMGSEFSEAFLKLKRQEWNSYVSHFSQWERDNTLDV